MAESTEATLVAVPDAAEHWQGKVNTVTIGATPEEGGTRERTVTVGGARGIPFIDADATTPNPPVIAVDVLDTEPEGWPAPLEDVYSDVWGDPGAWAKRAVELGADLVNLRLEGTHPDSGDRSPEEAAETVKTVLRAVKIPLIIWGADVPNKDRVVMPKVAEAAQGESCLLGAATETEYRTITAAAQAYNHKLISLAPCDINKQKQVNILVGDTGYAVGNLVLYPTTAALGYGMEYIYSILERGRLAALSGDTFLAQPVILDVGAEAWRAKEAKAAGEFEGLWGSAAERGPVWEAVTATNYLQGGADILIMRHPKAIEKVRGAIPALAGT